MKSFLPSILTFAALSFSAHGALTVFVDDFESPFALPDEGFLAGLPGWNITGSSAGFTGRFNADDDTGISWYHGIPAFEDTSGSGGVVNSMDGPTKGTIFAGGGANGGGDVIELLIGTIEADTLYEAVIALSGGRTAGGADLPLGYSIDLMAGSTVLNSTSGSAADAAALLFDDVSVAWSSDLDTLPSGVNIGDDLFFRITTEAAPSVAGKNYYLDFDNARFSETIIPEPSHSLLLALTGIAIVLRRRRD